MLPEKNRYIFYIFLATSLILRFYTFFQGVIDHDESTYLIIGRDIVLGKHLYVDVTDTKPVGIFLIYALFFKVFGTSLFFPRMMVSVVIAATSWFLFKISLKLNPQKNVAFAAGFIYIIYTSLWSQFGISPNTEQFFNLTTAAGLLLALNHTRRGYFFSGLIFGLGFIIKYLVLFDFVFLFGFFFMREFIFELKNKGKIGWMKYFIAGVAFSLPFLLSNLFFWLKGDFEAFRFITYELPFRYGKDPAGWGFLMLLLDYLARFLPISAMFFYVLFSKSKVIPRWQVKMYLAWLVGILIAMFLPGRSFDHYTIQMMLPFSLVAAWFFHPFIKKGRILMAITTAKGGQIILALILIIAQTTGIAGEIIDNNRPRKVAEYLKLEMKDDETLYLSNYYHIIYYLNAKDCPTKYVHPTLLTNPAHSQAFGIDGPSEIRKIMDSKPDYVVMLKPYLFLESLMDDAYHPVKEFMGGKIVVWKIKQ
jgi:hypothetical protein